MSSETIEELYETHILPHFESAIRRGIVSGDGTGAARNDACGDQVHVALQIEGTTIRQVRYEATGCVICQAASSIVCEHIEGREIAVAQSLNRTDVLKMLRVPLTSGKQRWRRAADTGSPYAARAGQRDGTGGERASAGLSLAAAGSQCPNSSSRTSRPAATRCCVAVTVRIADKLPFTKETDRCRSPAIPADA